MLGLPLILNIENRNVSSASLDHPMLMFARHCASGAIFGGRA